MTNRPATSSVDKVGRQADSGAKPMPCSERNKISFKLNPIRCDVLSACKGGGGYAPRGPGAPKCGEGITLSKKLGCDYRRPVGAKLCERLRDSLDHKTNPTHSPARTSLPKAGGRRSLDRSTKLTSEASSLRTARDDGHTMFPFSTFRRTEKGWWRPARGKPEGTELLRGEHILQDGRHSHAERSPTPGRLDDEDRSERCVLRNSGGMPTPEIPCIPLARKNIPIQLPAVRSVVGSVGLYQDHKASSDNSEILGSENDHLHRRHTDPGGRCQNSTGTHRVHDLPAGELGTNGQQREIPDEPNPRTRIPGPHHGLSSYATQTSGIKDQRYSIRCESNFRALSTERENGVETAGQTSPSRTCDDGCTLVLPTSATLSTTIPGAIGPGLLPDLSVERRSAGRTDLVDHKPPDMERQIYPETNPGPDNRKRCFRNRLGSPVREHTDRRALVQQRSQNAYQLPRTTGSLSGDQELCQRPKQHLCPSANGQFVSPDVYQQVRRHSLSRTKPDCEGTLDMVFPEEHYHHGSLPARGLQRGGRPRIETHDGPLRLAAQPADIREDQSNLRPTGSGPICIPPHDPAANVCELASRPISMGDRCLHSELEPGQGIRQSPLESDRKSPEPNQAASSYTGSHSPRLEGPTVVSDLAGDDYRETSPDKGVSVGNPTHTPGQPARYTAATSRVAYLRERFSDQRLSEEASRLMLASWRQKSGKSYDSQFAKWAGWCHERDIDPVSGDITGVINFLADLFYKGYQHRSICAYRSAISSVHEKVDGHQVGSHPMVSRLLKGVFHERPPQPRYSTTWNVQSVTDHIETLEDNPQLGVPELTMKLTMLLALTRPSRSTDLTNLDIRFRHYSPEGVTFQPMKLAKQSREKKPIKEFFFPRFTQKPKLCPVRALEEYERRTANRRSPSESQLLIAMIRPYKAVSSSTVARWLKAMLANSGIDVSIFKAHSVRGAATSAAANAGITTNDILNAADWSSQSIFHKFYYRPVQATAHLVKRCLQDSCRPLKASYKVTLIWRPSILKYNYRMAQTTQWSPAILDYMKNVRLTYQRPTTTHPVLTRLLRFSSLQKRPMNWTLTGAFMHDWEDTARHSVFPKDARVFHKRRTDALPKRHSASMRHKPQDA